MAFDFTQEVIQKSHERPVVVDFWASWCGPCRTLGPIIEQLADEAKGQWELVKVSTEEHPHIAQQYQIMSIPAVKMFYKGEVVADFVGALPRHQIQRWLDDHLPNEHKQALQDIIEQLRSGEREQALQQLEVFVLQHPELLEAHLVLALHTVSDDPVRARDLVEEVTLGHPMYDQAEDVRTLANFYEHTPEDESPVAKRMSLAQQAAKENRLEDALKTLVEAVTINKNYADDLPRKTMIAFFHLLGSEHPLTKAYRPRFNMALY